jgi:hypothetical protein
MCETRETYREGWPLLTVETEANGDSKSTNEQGLPWLVRCAHRAGTRDFCPALAALVAPVQKVFFLTRTLFQFICPHRTAIWGKQSCRVVCLLVCVSVRNMVEAWRAWVHLPSFWLFFYVLYSTLLHLLPVKFHCVGGCWDRIQDCCDFGIQTLLPIS